MQRKALLISLVAVVVFAEALWSQIRTRVELVVVPVNVRDGEGKLVTGLTKEDFVVTEDGQPQTITNFSIDPQPLSAAIIVDDGMGGDALRRLSPLFVAVTAGFT